MSKRPKAFLKQAKAKQKKEQTFETADDYLNAGVDFEEAAGKWRAGNAAKSMRFFQRAIEVYDKGLASFPASLDLAYNKARVLFEVATHPILVEQLQQPRLDALRLALDAHRYALKLGPDNADALFNAAQVLTSIAEEIANDDSFPDKEALKLLEEALELQNKCLSIQELKYEESLEQERLASEQVAESSTEGGILESTQASEQGPADQEEQWFTVVEPVTLDTLTDTVLAQLQTLTTLCSILSGAPESVPAATLPWVEEYSTKLVQKLPIISQGKTERRLEIALTKANFISALLEAGFRSRKVDGVTYKRERDAAFAVPELLANGSAEALIANAESLIAFNAALMDFQPSDSTARWNALTEGIKHFTTAAKLQGIDPSELAKTHLLRGDANLCLHALGYPPTSHQAAITNAAGLLKNADVFYRNASKLSPEPEDKSVATLRSMVSQHMLQQLSEGKSFDAGVIIAGSTNGPQWAVDQLEGMVAEGLLPQSLVL
ncbi:hypothetical protein BJ170DRAFT_599593 [Xylariales sp. AK1849]|nr:hypothetical protein BJ170DRAFT_599593 [Xylariales sp. AK1849]